MLLWPLMLVLAPVSGQLARTHKSIISLQPPWTTVFQGERVTLTCKGFPFYPQQKTKWFRLYLGKEIPRETPANTLEVRESGEYRCQARGSSPSSPVRLVFSSELFSRPVLRASSSQPINGSLVTLTCDTQLSLERSDVQLQFCFFRDGQTLGLGWTNSSKFQITVMWSEDAGSFWCEIDTVAHTVKKESPRSLIRVQKPVPLPQILTESSSISAAWCNLTMKCRVLGTTEDLDVIWETQGLPRELEQRGTLGPSPNSWTLAVSLSPSQRNASLTCVVSNNVDQKTATKDLGEVCWAQKSVQQGTGTSLVLPLLCTMLVKGLLLLGLLGKLGVEFTRKKFPAEEGK
ncbi:Fc receptor-like protein 5 isoform X2 [Saimiri boliviensis]|uniref:Fc receptor-like protein 5 isoform X2 n=1 Tax=Saimiri boliviensis TaxID=27679 RepID=UPI003D76D358